MRLIISRAIRQYKKEQLPYTCYAAQHLPYSLNDTCDCKKKCKFPPRGNSFVKYSQILFPYPLIIPYSISPPQRLVIESTNSMQKIYAFKESTSI